MLSADQDVPKWLIKSCVRYLEMFRLHEWEIRLVLQDTPGNDENTEGICMSDPSTMTARIEISRAVIQDKVKAKQTVFHEVLHLILAPLQDTQYRLIELLEYDGQKRDLYGKWFDDLVERVIRRLENSLYSELNG